MKNNVILTVVALTAAWHPYALADEYAGDAQLAQALANPIAALISVPFQFNYQSGIGPVDDGRQVVLNIQPVIPFSLNEEWNLISRTILPVVDQRNIFPGAGSQTGISDVVQSFFFSPKAPTSGGWVWGAGPVLLLPTGSNDLLTTDKWGIGPTAVALRQQGPWTTGMLANHIWSYAGNSDRSDVSRTLLQPFVSYTLPSSLTLNIQTESTYDHERSEWQVPIRFNVLRVVRLGSLPVQVGGGVTYWAESQDSGPSDWSYRFQMTLLFPAAGRR